MIDMTQVGAHTAVSAAGHRVAHLGVYLPGITAAGNFQVVARLIHEDDQFDPDIPARNFPLSWSKPGAYDLWSASFDITAHAGAPGSFGQPGRYLYRFQLLQNGQMKVQWFTDPCAREAGEASLALFDTEEQPPVWTDGVYKTPALDDLVVYELQVEQFNDTFDGVSGRLKYLTGLGVNCLELMPVTSLKQDFDWGYGPLHFFAPRDRFGHGRGLRRLIDTCHAQSMAVILDSVYQHVDPDFAYYKVYQALGMPSPMMTGGAGQFGPEVDFAKSFTLDYFQAVNHYWLDSFHVDGFRYDYVPGFYDGDPTRKYGTLVYNTYQDSLTMPRFQTVAGYSGLLQVAEDLDDPKGILRQTYTNATWQNDLLNKAEDTLRLNAVDDDLCHILDPLFRGYPATQKMNNLDVPVAPFQYVNSHDHSFLIRYIDHSRDDDNTAQAAYADRSQSYRLQPYAIALYTCQGVPMLWEGQEFGDNYVLPPSGDLRIHFRRAMEWRYFYDEQGQALVRLHRILGRLRRNQRALRGRESFYYNEQSRPGEGIVAYHRRAASTAAEAEQIAMVVLNFSPSTKEIWVPFPKKGTYRESIDADPNGVGPFVVNIQNDGDFARLQVPSHYGYIYLGP
jgi:maltooligosyltrehalose trehalohydrolase